MTAGAPGGWRGDAARRAVTAGGRGGAVTAGPPGVAPERTLLAWTRTALSAGVCALLLLRLAAGSTPRLVVAAALGVPAAAVLAGAARHRSRRLRAAAPGEPVRAAATAAVVSVLLALAAAVLIVLP